MVKARVHAGKQYEHGRYGHDTEAAQLHEDDEHPVAECREGAADVDDGKAGHAHCGCGCEERLEEVNGFACRDRQAQEYRAHGYEHQVAENHQGNRVGLPLRLEDVLGRRIGECLILGTKHG